MEGGREGVDLLSGEFDHVMGRRLLHVVGEGVEGRLKHSSIVPVILTDIQGPIQKAHC